MKTEASLATTAFLHKNNEIIILKKRGNRGKTHHTVKSQPENVNVKIIASCIEHFLSSCPLAFSRRDQSNTNTNKRGQQTAQRNKRESETSKKPNMRMESMAIVAELRRLMRK